MSLMIFPWRAAKVSVEVLWEIVCLLYAFSMWILPSIFGKILFVMAIGWVIFWAVNLREQPLAFAAAIFGPPLFAVGFILFCVGMALLEEWDKENLIKRGLY